MKTLKFSLLCVIISLIHIEAASPIANCVYSNDYMYGYQCKLSLINADESTPITGQHLDGKSDEDVDTIDGRYTDSNVKTFPANFCEKFINVKRININEIGLEEIDENSFKNCQNLEVLFLNENKIKKISKNAFASLPKLTNLLISRNQLTELDQELFQNLPSLKDLILSENQLQTLPDGIFSSLINLEHLNLSQNRFTKLHYSWFGDTVKKLKSFHFRFNNINSMDREIINNNPDLMDVAGNLNPCISDSTEWHLVDTESERREIKAYLSKCSGEFTPTTTKSTIETSRSGVTPSNSHNEETNINNENTNSGVRPSSGFFDTIWTALKSIFWILNFFSKFL